MPIGYLATVALLAWCTALAVAPRRPAHSSPSNMSFRFGFLINELPFVGFYWLVAATLLAAVQGDLDTPVGWSTLGLAVVTTGALAIVARRGLAAAPVVARAMDDGLGADWRAAIAADEFGRLRRGRPLWGRTLIWPFPIFRRDVERVANVRYGDARQMEPARRLSPSVPTAGRPDAHLLPRRRVPQRPQEPRGAAAHLPARQSGLGVHQRQLPAEPSGDVLRPPDRRQAGHRLGARTRLRIRRRPERRVPRR